MLRASAHLNLMTLDVSFPPKEGKCFRSANLVFIHDTRASVSGVACLSGGGVVGSFLVVTAHQKHSNNFV